MEIKVIDKDIYCDGEKVAQLIDMKSSQAKWGFKDFLDRLELVDDIDGLSDSRKEIDDLEDKIANLESDLEDKDIEIDNLNDDIRDDLKEYFAWLENEYGEADKEQLEQAIAKWTDKIKRKWL